MKLRTAVYAGILAGFVLFTAWCVQQEGYFGIFEAAFARPGSAQVFVDLGVALLLVSSGLRADAARRGLSPWPWLLATPLLGSIAPLGYFVYRDLVAPEPAPAAS